LENGSDALACGVQGLIKGAEGFITSTVGEGIASFWILGQGTQRTAIKESEAGFDATKQGKIGDKRVGVFLAQNARLPEYLQDLGG
jgi:hypothetical protein